jgi:glycosyltransferase involved in cell wall biosynthesis
VKLNSTSHHSPSVCHLAASASGGAGIAAFRVHRALHMAGVNSLFLSSNPSDSGATRLQVLARERPSLLRRVMVKFGAASGSWQRWQRQLETLDCGSVFTSSYEGAQSVSHLPAMLSSEILHLHWVSGMVDWSTFFHTRQRPLVWTLHDMNPFLGIFHYQFDKLRAGHRSQQLDHLVQKRKIEWLRHIPSQAMTIVCPSEWMRRESQNSDVLGRFEHVVIRYCTDTSVFRPLPQPACRDIFQLPEQQKLVLVVAENLNDPRKGLDLAVQGFSSIAGHTGIHVVVAGSGKFDISGVKVHHVGTVQDPRLMAILYNAVDLTVVPSREDNLPNVIIESLCCGTPVLCTPTGGMPELVCNKELGRVAAECTAEAVRAAASEALATNFHRARIAEHAAGRFLEASIAAQYQDVYKQLVGRVPVPNARAAVFCEGRF